MGVGLKVLPKPAALRNPSLLLLFIQGLLLCGDRSLVLLIQSSLIATLRSLVRGHHGPLCDSSAIIWPMNRRPPSAVLVCVPHSSSSRSSDR